MSLDWNLLPWSLKDNFLTLPSRRSATADASAVSLISMVLSSCPCFHQEINVERGVLIWGFEFNCYASAERNELINHNKLATLRVKIGNKMY